MAKAPHKDKLSSQELDEVTIEHAKKGRESACRALFRCYRGRVNAYLWRMLVNSADHELVDDLIQEVFIRVFRALPGFSTSGPALLSTWIYRITHNVALNEIRKRKGKTPEPLDPERIKGLSKTDEPAMRKHMSIMIKNAVERLSEDQRAVFLLREYHGQTYEEISRTLQVEIGTVRSRLARAREALRIALEEVIHD